MQYIGLCGISRPIALLIIAGIFVFNLIIIIKRKVWFSSHCLWVGHETMACAVSLTMFLCIYYGERRAQFFQIKLPSISTKILAYIVLSFCWLLVHPVATISSKCRLPSQCLFVFQMTGDYSSMLSIGHASPRHNGNYTCLATNMAASGNLTATFHVDGKHGLQLSFNPFE